MKTKRTERLLLLEQSGEMTARQKRRLQRVMETSPEIRRLRTELNFLNRAVLDAGAEPPEWSTDKIINRLRTETGRHRLCMPVWKPVFAIAAGLAVVASIWNFTAGKPLPAMALNSGAETEMDLLWDDPFGAELAELENLLLTISVDLVSFAEL